MTPCGYVFILIGRQIFHVAQFDVFSIKIQSSSKFLLVFTYGNTKFKNYRKNILQYNKTLKPLFYSEFLVERSIDITVKNYVSYI